MQGWLPEMGGKQLKAGIGLAAPALTSVTTQLQIRAFSSAEEQGLGLVQEDLESENRFG